jgi:hypothetical protein
MRHADDWYIGHDDAMRAFHFMQDAGLWSVAWAQMKGLWDGV